jgi:hypothetical protein
MLQILSSPLLQYFQSMMKPSFNSWELSLIYVITNIFIFNKIVRRGKRSIYLISFEVLKRNCIYSSPYSRESERKENMSRERDDCECFNCAFLLFRKRFRRNQKRFKSSKIRIFNFTSGFNHRKCDIVRSWRQ